MTKAYCEGKLKALIRDHNHYIKVGDSAAVKDYRRAIDDLVYVASRRGIKLNYTVSKTGYINE